jgi:hypothetical protein
MDRTILLNDVDEHDGSTYAEPLAGLRVSWGAILAGALAIVAVSGILWAFAAAITLTAANATVSSMKGTLIALWVCAIATTLIGAFAGGWLAAYLPGNKNRLIGAVHGGLAWALAFVFMSGVGFTTMAGMARTATETTMTAASAAVEGGASVAGGDAALERRARDMLLSLGYSPADANRLVGEAQSGAQRSLRENQPNGPAMAAMMSDALRWTAGFTWAWAGTWLVSGFIAVMAALFSIGQLRPRVRTRTRPVETAPVITEQPA